MAKTALLVCDVQRGIVSRFLNSSVYLPLLGTAITAARSAGARIIYVTAAFRPGYPDVSPNNMLAAMLTERGGSKGAGAFVEGDESTEIPPEVAPLEGDIVVRKRRVSAFAGSDLDLVLRSLGIVDFAVAGIATSGVVLSTVREGADLDYRVTVLEDLCLERDQEVHKILMEKVFPRQAEVVKWENWVEGIKK